MSDKPVSHKRPMVKRFRVVLKYLAKPEPQQAPRKQVLRPLTEKEKLAILSRAHKGQACQKIASELGIPFALVHFFLRGIS